jgi:hypothetical protein
MKNTLDISIMEPDKLLQKEKPDATKAEKEKPM